MTSVRPAIGFGLDPAGYSTRRSVIAAIHSDGDIARAVLLRECPFSTKITKDRLIQKTIETERNELRRLISLGNIAIDVPLDLQHLPSVQNPVHSWQLTKRPVDEFVGGMPPLASLIGHVTARFQAMLDDSYLKDCIGVRIFETYPKPALKNLLGNNWKFAEKYKTDKASLAYLCGKLRISDLTEIRSDDDLDAIVCAVTAVVSSDHLMHNDDYGLVSNFTLPLGYRILNKNPFKEIQVSSIPYDRWIAENLATQ